MLEFYIFNKTDFKKWHKKCWNESLDLKMSYFYMNKMINMFESFELNKRNKLELN